MIRDVEDYRHKCRQYLFKKGVRHEQDAEDLLSEMMLYALEHPGEDLSMKYLYLNAVDRLKPRRTMPDGSIGRQSDYTDSISLPTEEYDDSSKEKELSTPESAEIIEWPNAGMVRAMGMLSLVYGMSNGEIAEIFGVKKAAVSRIVRPEHLAVQCGMDEGKDYITEGLEYDVDWMTL